MRRTQVAEKPQPLAQRQQALLRTTGWLDAVPLRAADGTQQDAVAPFAGIERLIGKGNAIRVNRASPEQMLLEREAVAEFSGRPFHHLDRLVTDIGTDSVPGHHHDTLVHSFTSCRM